MNMEDGSLSDRGMIPRNRDYSVLQVLSILS